MNSLTRFFVFCSGADIDVLKQCTKSEVNKFSIIGTTVLIPALLSVITIGYAIWMISNNIYAVIVGCIIWPTIIFFIERAFVANMKPYVFNGAVLLRLIGAVIISFTISEIVLLGVFQDNINQKLSEELVEKKELINQKYDKQIVLIENEIAQAKDKVDVKEKEFLNEIDGVVISGFGTGKKGYGDAAKKKEEALTKEQEYFEHYKQGKTSELETITSKREDELRTLEKNHATGLLGRMIALSELADNHTHVFWATWLLRFLFIVLETLPLVIKLTTDKNGNQYYVVLKKNEELQIQMLDETSEAQLIVEKMRREHSLKVQQFKLQDQTTQLVVNSEVSHSKLFNERLQEVIKMHLAYKAEAVQKIKDPALLEKVLYEIDSVLNGYMRVQEHLIAKSIDYHKM